MPTYEHYQTLKAVTVLPGHPSIGACLTGTSRQAEARRAGRIVPKLQLSVHPSLLPHSVIVNRGGACNRWKAKTNKKSEAAAYAERGEKGMAANVVNGASLMQLT